ncbi:hypothetical protein A8F94_09670 [Bacillus sp. FJAT-27225]|uniref:tubulin-like doman-containing protein n=1 Tax=Bacillus sp. FJAT-27225 TaxID=1743144 RepID=UPI00080C25C0|nr:tubulin-like doman-containing protein [Bacillus sp. FJAT-27225]OCA88077.1 hypothetical protein A8F94_09670 [Bacillus sp. FJAT-27225]
MKASVREHIEQLDVSMGGGIVSDKIRVDTIDNPMLVIGLGGTGIDALLRLKYQINRKFKLPQDPLTKKKAEKPDNIEYLAFETNETEINKKHKGIGLDPIKEFVLLSNPQIGATLQSRSLLPAYITDWLSPELTITDGINGASGVRQAGRLLLFTKINQVVHSISTKIEALLEGTNKKLYVFLLTGLSGGTGSGSYLDISYIVRGIIERKFGPAGVDRVHLLGYLFTPDVNLARRGLNTQTKDYIQKNGFAALKELDYWMNAEERKERFQAQYGSALTVNSSMPPFNLCHLISATNIDGKLLENAYDYCMNVAAENITNFMANEEKTGDEFAIHDYISNIRTNIANMQKLYPANYEYNIIGASLAEIPIEEMTTYVGYKLFEKMNSMFDANPDQNDVDQFAERLRIDPDSIHRRFNERVPEPLSGYENSERFSYNNVIKQIVNLDEELTRDYLEKAKDQYRKCTKQLPGEIVEEFRAQMERLFLNPKQGPIYASKLVYSNKGFCLLKTIQVYITGLQDRLARLPRDIQGEQDYAYGRFEDARSAFISKEKKKNAYIEAKRNEYYARADKARIEEMITFYEDLYQLLNNENNRIYDVYREILETLKGIFQKNADILVNGQEVKTANEVTYYWQLVSVPDVAREIQRMFDSKDGEQLVREWSQMLVERSVNWVKETDIDVIGSISEFLSEQFGELITKSMEDFLRLKYGEDEPIDKIIEQKIARQLDNDALPVFDLQNSIGNLNFPHWGFVSVPAKAPNILKGIRNYQRVALSHASFTVKESELKNRIFWLNTKNGIPLFAYTPLKNYEAAYESTILDKEGIGRHLVQTEKVNWAYLPSPIPEQSWGDTYENPRLREYNNRIRNMFDEARRYGAIVEKDIDTNSSARYACVFTKSFSVEALLFESNIDPKQLEKTSIGELKRFVRQLQDLFNGGLAKEPATDIFGSINEMMAKENFIRSPRLVDRMKEEVKKYRALEELIATLSAYIDSQRSREQLLKEYIEAMYTKTIQKKGALYVYDKELEEDPWEPFANIMSNPEFVEYEVFKSFQLLNEQRKTALVRKAARRRDELTQSEDATELIATLQELASAFERNKGKLDYERDDYMEGEDMYTFYKDTMITLNNMLTSLKGVSSR